jgi:hypothetical protein
MFGGKIIRIIECVGRDIFGGKIIRIIGCVGRDMNARYLYQMADV